MSGTILGQQGNIVRYGKNRVQYDDDFDNWDRYESKSFVTHWYGKGRKIAIATVQYAEYENEAIRTLLEHRTNEKTDIIVYTDISDLHQTNIGNNELFETRPGQVNVLGNKIFVYFDGNQSHLRRMIRKGIAQVYLAQMLLGDSWQQFFQNMGSSDYPDWYLMGLASYIGHPWSADIDNILRDIYAHNAYEDFYSLARDHPRIAGHAFWTFLVQHYGNGIIASILYLNRINRNIEAAFLYTLNVGLDALVEQVWNYYSVVYARDIEMMAMPSGKYKLRFKNSYCSRITEMRYSPDGNFIAFVGNELGQWKVYLYDLDSGEESVLMKGKYRNPFQIPDYNYPIIQWTEDGQHLLVIYEDKNEIKLAQIDRDGKVVEEALMGPRFERIYDMDILKEDTLIFAANTRGFGDLYYYYPRTRQLKRMSYDYFDELNISIGVWKGQKGYFFNSNRINPYTYKQLRDTSLVEATLDLYFYPFTAVGKDSGQVIRITDTDFNHFDPQYHNGYLYYIAERHGRRYLARLSEGGGSELISAWRSHIHTYTISKNKYAISLLDNGREIIYDNLPIRAIDSDNIYRPFMYSHIQAREKAEEKKSEDEQKEERNNLDTEDTVRVKLIYQSEFPDPENIPSFKNINLQSFLNAGNGIVMDSQGSSSDSSLVKFYSARVVASRLFFKTDGLDFSFDNGPLFSGLDSYAGEKQGYEYPPFGLLIKGRAYDVFEDYILEGGARYPVSLNGSEYFLTFKDRKRRWDKIYGIYRKSEKHIQPPEPGAVMGIQRRAINYIGIYEMRYPFSMFKSLRLRATFRQDRLITYASDSETLLVPTENSQRIGLRAAYVFDNTYDLAYNMKSGLRYKFYVEVMNRFKIRFSPWEFNPQEGFMTVLGFDARKYFRLGNYAIFAMRGVGATSFGTEQILFLMGGVRNWLFPKYSGLSQPGEGNFVYRGLAAEMRGFRQNVRNGSSYVLGNFELRVAPFNYLSKKELESAFLKNFQLVGFFDVGTAWYGLSPYSPENPLNIITVENAISEVRARYYRDPLIVGYGIGARIMLFNLFFRIDYAWGVDTRRVGDPVWYLSMGKDF